MKKSYVVVGMQFGDEAKGQTVNWLCRNRNVSLVVRYGGGHQCGHNVENDGVRHTFSSFGSGALNGVHTHIGPHAIINWYCIDQEMRSIEQKTGEFPSITVDPSCLVTLPYHAILDRARRSVHGHGTCGVGIGETRRYWLKHGYDAVYASDDTEKVRKKIRLMRYRMQEELLSLSVDPSFYSEFMSLNVEKVIERHQMYARPGTAVRDTYTILHDHSVVAFEGHQGVLLDETYGFHPHTTWSDTTARHAIELSECVGVDPFIIGCTRAFTTRHGNGPLPTHDMGLKLTDPGNQYNDNQGHMRFGWLDLPLLHYAAKACPVHATAVSWIDEYEKIDGGCVAADYAPDREALGYMDYELKRRVDFGLVIDPIAFHSAPTLDCQSEKCEYLKRAKPIFEQRDVAGLLSDIERIAPVGLIGRGPEKRIDTGVIQ